MNAKNASSEKAETNELAYYDALKRIAAYQSPDQLRRGAEKQYGLDYEEALEMAYENVLAEAKAAVRGKRRPGSGAAVQTAATGEKGRER